MATVIEDYLYGVLGVQGVTEFAISPGALRITFTTSVVFERTQGTRWPT